MLKSIFATKSMLGVFLLSVGGLERSATVACRYAAQHGSDRHMAACAARIFLTTLILGLMFSEVSGQTPVPWTDPFDGALQPGWFWVNEDPSHHWFDDCCNLYIVHLFNAQGNTNRLLRPAPAGQYSIVCYGDQLGTYEGLEIETLLYSDNNNFATLEWDPYLPGAVFDVVDHGVGRSWDVPDDFPNAPGLLALGYVPDRGSIHVLMGERYVWTGLRYDKAPIDSLFPISFVPRYVGFETAGCCLAWGDTIRVAQFTIEEFPYVLHPQITDFTPVGSDLRVAWQTNPNYRIPPPADWELEARVSLSNTAPIVSPRLPSSSSSYTFISPPCSPVPYFAYVDQIPSVGNNPWQIGHNPDIYPPTAYLTCPKPDPPIITRFYNPANGNLLVEWQPPALATMDYEYVVNWYPASCSGSDDLKTFPHTGAPSYYYEIPVPEEYSELGGGYGAPYQVRMKTHDVRRNLDSDWSVAPSVQCPSIPIFLVPGLFADADVWNTTGFTQKFDNIYSSICGVNTQLKFNFIYPVTGLNNTGDPNEVFFDINAQRLSAFIDSKLHELEAVTLMNTGVNIPITRCDIIAHSMGGLIARRYISGYDAWANIRPVRKLFMLGTPNLGSYAADAVYDLAQSFPAISYLLLPRAVYELSRANIYHFNQLFNNLHGTQCYLAAGSAGLERGAGNTLQPGNRCNSSLELAATCSLERYPNDGIVSVKSATTLPGSQSIWIDTEHGRLLCHCCVNDEYRRDDVLFNSWIVPRMQNTGGPRADQTLAAVDTSEILPQFIYSNCDSIFLGQARDYSFRVDGGSLFIAITPTDMKLGASVESPKGVIWNPASFYADSSAEYIRSSYCFGYSIAHADSGTWTVHVHADSIVSRDAAFCIQSTIGNGIIMSVNVPHDSVAYGDSVLITVGLTENNADILGANITAQPVFADSVSLSKLLLHDDGRHGDGAADDGLYGGYMRQYHHEGNYLIKIEAQGISPLGRSFVRLGDTYAYWKGTFAGIVDQLPRPGSVLRAVYPNPFNPAITIVYETPSPGIVRIDVYNTGGGHVITIKDGLEAKGKYQISWNGQDKKGNLAASGIYFIRAEYMGHKETRKVVLLR